MSLGQVLNKIVKFRDERDWAQFHTPRNLATALSIEAAELQETMLWKTDEEIRTLLRSDQRDRVCEELADVLIFGLLLAQELEADPIDLILKKLSKNEDKYPLALAKGNATKYTDL